MKVHASIWRKHLQGLLWTSAIIEEIIPPHLCDMSVNTLKIYLDALVCPSPLFLLE